MLKTPFPSVQKHVRDQKSMSFVPEIPNPFLAAFASGLFYGLAFCTSACLPYVASYIAGIGAGFRKGLLVTLAYNSGRIIAYAMIGGAIAILSGAFRLFLSESSFLPFQRYSSFAFGIVTIVIGVTILARVRKPLCTHTSSGGIPQRPTILGRKFDFGAFSLGLSRGLVICPALLALLVSSLPFATPIDSFAIAVLFGLGTALSPLIILGGATGWLLNKAPLFRKWISMFGGFILIAFGVGSIWMSATVGST